MLTTAGPLEPRHPQRGPDMALFLGARDIETDFPSFPWGIHMDEVVATRREAAAKLDITERSLADWARQPWFPKDAVEIGPDGRRRNWNVAQIRSARNNAGRKGSDQSERSQLLTEQIKQEQLESLRLKNERARLEHAINSGNVLQRDVAELSVVEAITITRDRLGGIAKELCRCVPRKFHAVLRAEGTKIVRSILDDFARLMTRSLDEDAD